MPNIEDNEITSVAPKKFYVLFNEFDTDKNRMKTMEAMNVGSGALVRTSTELKNPDGSISVSEALAFVPGMTVVSKDNVNYRLVSR